MNLYWPKHPFRSDAASDRRRATRWTAAEAKATQALVLSHGGCLDGVTSAVITQRVLGAGAVGVAYCQPSDVATALEVFATRPGDGRKLFVCDLSLQKPEFQRVVAACQKLKASGWVIEWRDHHHKQWEGLELAPLRAAVAVLDVNADATESGASMQQKALAPDDAFLKAFAETVRDRDLWWNKTPDSETLEFALTNLGPRDFAANLLSAKGPGVIDAVFQQAAQAERDAQQDAKHRLLDAASYHGPDTARVGIVYGWLPKNTGLHELLTEHGCHVAVNVRPNGKVSLRSRKEIQVCHTIAQAFDGGGHPNASGCDLGLQGPRYWWYVVRRGQVDRVQQLADLAVKTLQART